MQDRTRNVAERKEDAESIRYLFLDTKSSLERVLTLGGDPPKIGEQEAGVFHDATAVYEVVYLDPQPFMLYGDLIEGGRIWVRRII